MTKGHKSDKVNTQNIEEEFVSLNTFIFFPAMLSKNETKQNKIKNS